MMVFNKMWKNIKTSKIYKRNIKEIKYENIDLKEYIIIDVRSRREFKEYHLNNSMNIPLSEIKNIDKYVRDKEKKILVYCEYGIRSKKAAEQLEKLGYVEVYNLKGGIENI